MKRPSVVISIVAAFSLVCLLTFSPCSLAKEPLLSPGDYLPVSKIHAGMKGVGKTVFHGTKIEQFDVTVVGVLKAWNFDMDMILVRIDSGYVVEKKSGVIAGMSGSPIYINGKLIGAIAYGFIFNTRVPIAGVTPIESMVRCVEDSGTKKMASLPSEVTFVPRGGKLKIGGHTIKRVCLTRHAARSTQHAARDTLVLKPVMTPLMVRGVSPRALARLKRLFEPYGLLPVMAPGGASKVKVKASLQPGAAVGVQFVAGDYDLTGVGTVTHRKGNTLLVFGHPALLSGKVEMPMTTAYVHDILISDLDSFKLASPLQPVGTFNQDRAFAVAGQLWKKPDTLPAEIAITDLERNVSRRFRVELFRHPDFMTLLLDFLISDAVGVVASETIRGTTRVSFEVIPEGLPPIRRENVIIHRRMGGLLGMLFGAMFFDPTQELTTILDILEENPYQKVKVRRVKVSMDISQERKETYIERLGCSKRRVKPGEEVELQVTLRHVGGQPFTKTLKFKVPEHAPKGELRVGVSGGGDHAQSLRGRVGVRRDVPQTLPQLIQQRLKYEPNNHLVFAAALPTFGMKVNKLEVPSLPFSLLEMMRSVKNTSFIVGKDELSFSIPMETVISGVKTLTLHIEPEQQKETPQLSGEFMMGGEDFEEVFGEIFRVRDIFGVAAGRRASLSSIRPELVKWSRLKRRSYDEGDDDGTFGALESPPEESTPPTPPSEVKPEDKEEEPSRSVFEEGDEKGKPKNVWVQKEAKEFEKGKTEGCYISADGTIRLGVAKTRITSVPDPAIWCCAASSDGICYAASWLSGKIYRLSPDKEAELVAHLYAGLITALSALPDGTLLVATSPKGKILKMQPSPRPPLPEGGGQEVRAGLAKLEPFCQVPAEFVWKLVALPDGSLLAATGMPGQIHRISADGNVELVLDAKDQHILGLAVDDEGNFYAGTYPYGRLFKVTPAGESQALFETKQGAIQCVQVGKDGSIYVGTTPQGEVYQISPQGDYKLLYKTGSRHVTDIVVGDNGLIYVSGAQRGAVYAVDKEGNGGKLLEDQDAIPLALSVNVPPAEPEAELDGEGEGNGKDKGEGDGEGEGEEEPSPPAPLPPGEGNGVRALSVLLSGRGEWASLHLSKEGTYTSPVHHLQIPARWGLLKWVGEVPEGTSLTFETRTGNTAFPDKSWSDWQATERTEFGEKVISPPATYVQYRVKLKGNGKASPVLRRTELYLKTINVAPTVKITAPAPGDIWSKKKTITWQAGDRNGDKLTFEVFYSSDGGETWTKIEEKKEEEKEEEKKEEKKESEEAEQKKMMDEEESKPEEEEAKVKVKKSEEKKEEPKPGEGKKGEPKQKGGVEVEPPPTPEISEEMFEGLEMPSGPSEAGLEKKSLEWDTKKVPDGRYIIKVVASDEESNPLEPLTAQALSTVVIVDNTAPALEDPKVADPKQEVPPPEKLIVVDALSPLLSADYKLDDGKWRGLTTEDRIFDAPKETIVLPVKRLPDGKHKLTVRVRDAAGNEATFEFTYVKGEAKRQDKPEEDQSDSEKSD